MKYEEIDVPQTIMALSTLATAIGIVLKSYWDWRRNVKADAVAKETNIIAKETKTEMKTVHQLVNGQHMQILKQNAANARRLAMMTNLESDLNAARDAERQLEVAMVAEAKAELAAEAEKAKQAHTPDI